MINASVIKKTALSGRRHEGRALLVAAILLMGLAPLMAATGWLAWRGPEQTGVSRETGLPEKIVLNGENHLWTADFPGKSTPVIADGRLYILGYLGEGPDLQEGVACFDAETGQKLWQRLYNDYLSDTIYLRYATASPAVDPETGNVYSQGTQGLLSAFDRDGRIFWQHHLMELFGRLTFPNSRTASPLLDGELVIVRGITANWGAQGPGGDRIYAFDKRTGEPVWASSPGGRPMDNSFSHPVLGWYKGHRVLYTASGDGSVVCVNARTGTPFWRVPLFKAGINATVLVHNQDKVIAVFGTPYELGQMVALKIPDVDPAEAAANGPKEFQRADLELWSTDISSSTSSPILVGDTVYIVAEKGDLCSVDARSGTVHWKLKLGIEQRNSCPLYADGKLYVPILDDPAGKTESQGEAGNKGAFYIVRPGRTNAEILTHLELDGRCFGSPAVYKGRVYVQTASKLYCFGPKQPSASLPPPPPEPAWPAPGPAAQLQIIPNEVLLLPGEPRSFRVRALDARGFVVQEQVTSKEVKWSHYVPPTALVRATLNATFDSEGRLVAGPENTTSAGAFQAEWNGLKGYARGRILARLPKFEDFEGFTLNNTTTNAMEPPTPFAYPPLPWIGARTKFEVREKDGNKALVKTIDNKFFQRAFVFIGRPDMRQYTIEADVMSEGNRRKMSDVGVIAQRYLIVLKGNEQKLEINSNLERLRVPPTGSPPNFAWSANTWYRLKARVDNLPDGSGFIRAKAWKRGEPEPEAWTLEAHHATAHTSGSPGLYGFSPQEMRVFIDNVRVSPTEAK